YITFYSTHRYLPSFPTRRSSDLSAGHTDQPGANHGHRPVSESGKTGPFKKHLPADQISRTVCPVSRAGRSVQQATGPGPAATGGDRKSTRLNSSHVKISYAAFCL